MLIYLIGGWHVSGVVRWTSGFPITVDNGPDWATDWNIEGDAEPNGPPPVQYTQQNLTVNGIDVGPDMFANPVAAESAFRPDWPGESGVRNNVFGNGMFNIDTGVAKEFSLGESRRVEFSWQTFNTTNSVRYDVRGFRDEEPIDFPFRRRVRLERRKIVVEHERVWIVRIAGAVGSQIARAEIAARVVRQRGGGSGLAPPLPGA